MYSVSYLPTTYSYAFLYSYRILQMYIYISYLVHFHFEHQSLEPFCNSFSGPICCSQKLPTHGKSAKFVSCKQTPKRGVEGVVTSRQISHHRTKSKSRVSNALNLLASTRVWVLQKKGKIDGDANHFSVLWSLWKLLQTSAFSRQNNKNSRCLFEMSLS